MKDRRIQLLVLLLIVSVAVAGIAGARLASARSAALAAQDDLRICRSAIAQLTSNPGRAANSTPQVEDLNRRFRAAAASAALTDQQLPSIEPRRPMPVENTPFQQMSIFLGFERLTLQQLVTFLHPLISADPNCRPVTIELSPPEGQADANTWRADLELSYLIHLPGNASDITTPADNEEDQP